jgi:hypothetical protein
MSDLDEAGRALIALAGDAHDPTDEDRARVRTALAARLGAAAGLGLGAAAGLGATAKAAAGAGAAGSTAGAGAAAAGGTLAVKLVGVAVLLTTTVGVGAAVKLSRRAAHAPAAAKTSAVQAHRTVAAAAPRALPAPAADEAPREDPRPAAPAAGAAPGRAANNEAPNDGAPDGEARGHGAPPAPPPPRPAEAKARAVPAKIDARDVTGAAPRRRSAVANAANESDHACTPPSDAGAATRKAASGVADEARLVNDGVRALRAGQAACALALFDTHARYYPDGVLAEEREAERALALAELGRSAEARAAAATFLRRHPASPLGVRLRQRIPGIDAAAEAPTEAPPGDRGGR